MTNLPICRRIARLVLCTGFLLAAGCHRAPATAAELAKALPGTYSGNLHLQGETDARRIRLEPQELSVRDEHALEFNRVDYQMLDAHGGETARGEAHIRGTITVPGFAIHLETLGAGAAEGENAIRLDSFIGTLSQNLQSLDAEWSTGLGQKVRLTLQATP